MVYRLHLYILYIFVLCCVRRFSCSEGSKVKVPLLSALVLLPCCDVIYFVFVCLNYIYEAIEKAIFGSQSEFTCSKLVIETLEQSAKFCS